MPKTTLGGEPAVVFCKNCKWISQGGSNLRYAKCTHEAAIVAAKDDQEFLVSGEFKMLYCASARMPYMPCGPEGRMYEPA